MKIRVMSDLHLEVSDFVPARADADVVVLAGDIHTHTRGLEWATRTFPDTPIIYVSGNHEYYGAEFFGMSAQLRLRASQLGIHFLDDDEVVIEGVRFIGTTLWTDYALFGAEYQSALQKHAQDCMNDHRLIRIAGGRSFKPKDAAKQHRKHLAYIKSRLAERFDGPTVVVTHHAPSALSVPDRYKDDTLSAAFASHLDEVVSGADLWIHGHTHAFMHYRIGPCTVVCNPRGYATYRKSEVTGFVDPMVIEIA